MIIYGVWFILQSHNTPTVLPTAIPVTTPPNMSNKQCLCSNIRLVASRNVQITNKYWYKGPIGIKTEKKYVKYVARLVCPDGKLNISAPTTPRLILVAGRLREVISFSAVVKDTSRKTPITNFNQPKYNSSFYYEIVVL